jgi:UDP-glucuronate decarboxylase
MRNPIIFEDLCSIAGADIDWQRFSGTTVLVSGASGFLPAYMVETLLYLNEAGKAENVRVICLVRDIRRARERFAAYRDRSDLVLISQDVTAAFHISEPVDYIIHAASQASPKFFGSDPVGTLKANIIGTCNLLDLARASRVRGFLFFSSGEVYGEVNSSQVPTKEDDYGYLDPLKVRSCYAESKRMGENMAVSWHHQYGIPTKIVRPFHTYGPGMRLDDGRVFADFVADIINNRDIVLNSDGSATRAFCYLADATAGFFKVFLDGESATAYNVGNDRGEISILDLAELLVGLFPEKGLKVITNCGVTKTGYLKSTLSRNCPDISRIGKLGWQPQTGIKEGFIRTIRSYGG